jgi:hypothetical protein
MTLDWQEIAALSLVALACGYLLLRGVRLVRSQRPTGACGGCAKCAGGPATKSRVLIQVTRAEALSDRR